MIIGVPKEIKDHEYRVSVTPDGVRALRQAGHERQNTEPKHLILGNTGTYIDAKGNLQDRPKLINTGIGLARRPDQLLFHEPLEVA